MILAGLILFLLVVIGHSFRRATLLRERLSLFETNEESLLTQIKRLQVEKAALITKFEAAQKNAIHEHHCYLCSRPFDTNHRRHSVKLKVVEKIMNVGACQVCANKISSKRLANILFFDTAGSGPLHWRDYPNYKPDPKYWDINADVTQKIDAAPSQTPEKKMTTSSSAGPDKNHHLRLISTTPEEKKT